jgi:hypothetical protein
MRFAWTRPFGWHFGSVRAERLGPNAVTELTEVSVWPRGRQRLARGGLGSPSRDQRFLKGEKFVIVRLSDPPQLALHLDEGSSRELVAYQLQRALFIVVHILAAADIGGRATIDACWVVLQNEPQIASSETT